MASFFPGPQYLALPRDPHTWLVQNLIPTSGAANLYGQPKAGKSFAGLGLAAAISNPAISHWLNFPVMKHGTVAYLQVDTPRGIWADYVANSGLDFSNVHFSDTLLTPEFPMNVLNTASFDWLLKEMHDLQPVMLVLDTLRECHDGDENDSTVMRNVIVALQAAVRPATLLLLSHSRKATQYTKLGGDDLMGENRGSGYVAGKMDMVMQLTLSRLTWKGRAQGEGSIAVIRDLTTGLVQLDGEAAKQQTLLIEVVAEMRTANPGVTQVALAQEYLSRAAAKGLPLNGQSTVTRWLKDYYTAMKWK